MKRQIETPKFSTVFEYGNIHSKSVLVSVTVAGKTFEPTQPSPYKKHGKATAATHALKALGWVKEMEEEEEDEEGKGVGKEKIKTKEKKRTKGGKKKGQEEKAEKEEKKLESEAEKVVETK